MAEFKFSDLKSQYGDFVYPLAVLTVGGKKFSDNDSNLVLSNIEVELSCGFEASIATFWIYNSYNEYASQFDFDNIKNYIYMGSSVVLSLGYGTTAREVFRGFISGVRFVFREGEVPGVEVTAMDVKGAMMSGTYSKQLTATTYSAAVKEILQKTAYTKLKSDDVITSLNIVDTPDATALSSSSDDSSTIEMVAESDYEFIVKVAKKFNYEFFTVGGDVYFRKAKNNTDILIELGSGFGLRNFEIGYDITGLVEKVEVRGMDAGKSEAITKSETISNTISKGSKAKSVISGSEKVYIDPTVSSTSEAGYRANYLVEDISYRFGTLEAETVGLPELAPGRFIKVVDIGTAASNKFYIVNVRHVLDTERGYYTEITGKAASLS